MNQAFKDYSREQLLEIIDIYSKNWLAHGGVWFQSVERAFGMDRAMEHDYRVWEQFTKIEARRIRAFLKLPEQGGIEGLKRALAHRYYATLNRDEVLLEGEDTLIYRILDCRVQTARKRKGIPLHPCKSVGLVEHTEFAKVIDPRFRCEALSCYPDNTDDGCACSWKFVLV